MRLSPPMLPLPLYVVLPDMLLKSLYDLWIARVPEAVCIYAPGWVLFSMHDDVAVSQRTDDSLGNFAVEMATATIIF